MKLKRAIKIGKDCGLETIGEAICNIELHATNIFDFDKAQEEYNEKKEKLESMLKQIENGARFGQHISDWFESGFAPCELIEVIDRDNFIVKVKFTEDDSIEIMDLDDLYVRKS